MNLCQLRHSVCRFATIASLAALTVSIAVAQTTTTPTNKTNPAAQKPVAKAAPAVAAKPAVMQAKPAAAQPASQAPNAPTITKPVNASATTPLPTATPAATANQSVQPATGAVPQAATQAIPATTAPTYAAPASNAVSSASPTASVGGGDPRAPVAGQGIGTFLWPGGWTLIAYGCFRSGTRLFCDFDTTNQNNIPVNTGNFWMGGGGVNIVDDGGKITGRHNAFFVGTDGSQFDTAYISPQPVRFIIEYDNVDQRYTQVSLILGRDRIQNVPITLIDPSQPAGKMPARTVVASTAGAQPAVGAPATQAAAGANGALNQANNAVNNVQNQKKKAQSLLKSLQTAVQSH